MKVTMSSKERAYKVISWTGPNGWHGLPWGKEWGDGGNCRRMGESLELGGEARTVVSTDPIRASLIETPNVGENRKGN